MDLKVILENLLVLPVPSEVAHPCEADAVNEMSNPRSIRPRKADAPDFVRKYCVNVPFAEKLNAVTESSTSETIGSPASANAFGPELAKADPGGGKLPNEP